MSEPPEAATARAARLLGLIANCLRDASSGRCGGWVHAEPTISA
jgi:hypothetical protein